MMGVAGQLDRPNRFRFCYPVAALTAGFGTGFITRLGDRAYNERLVTGLAWTPTTTGFPTGLLTKTACVMRVSIVVAWFFARCITGLITIRIAVLFARMVAPSVSGPVTTLIAGFINWFVPGLACSFTTGA